MHKKKKPYALPQKNPIKGIGYAWDVKLFPDSKPGNSGGAGVGFPKPSQNPPTNIVVNPQSPPQDFQAWVDYYAGVVGYYVSVLNGLQFNLDEEDVVGPPNAVLRMMSDVLDEFATRLHIGQQYSAGFPNPQQLIWPLTGSYYFRYHFPAVNPYPQFWVDLDLFFECDPDTLVCINCLVKVRFTDALNKLDPVSAAFVAAVNAGGAVAGTEIQNPDFISSSSSYLATSSSSYP